MLVRCAWSFGRSFGEAPPPGTVGKPTQVAGRRTSSIYGVDEDPLLALELASIGLSERVRVLMQVIRTLERAEQYDAAWLMSRRYRIALEAAKRVTDAWRRLRDA